MKIPMSGPFNHGVLVLGCGIAGAACAGTMSAATITGPAVRADDAIKACGPAMLLSGELESIVFFFYIPLLKH
jgi:hypothetical protein